MSFLSPQALQSLENERLRNFVGNNSFGASTPWRERLPVVYPILFTKPFSDYHAEMWNWADGVGEEDHTSAFLAIWPRGSGKSTGAEVAAIELGASGKRRYCWYVRETQDQADKSLGNINALLETKEIEQHYPAMSERALSKYGKPRGWRRERLITSSGYTIDGMGLDKANRGVKEIEQRPDIIIFDDVDGRHDTLKTTAKKIETITQSIIPAGSDDVIILFIQNLIIPDGVMSQLVDGRAEFILDRFVSGPYPAAHNLSYEQQADGKYKVTVCEPTWPDGYGIDTIQSNINKWGPSAFEREAQHNVEKQGGMYDNIEFRHVEWGDLPKMERFAVWVDPAVTSTDLSDAMGIQADALGVDGKLYRLFSWEAITTPEDAIRRAITKCIELGGGTVGVETDQGGDTWRTVYNKVIGDLKAEELKKAELEDDYNENTWISPTFWPMFMQDKAGAGHGGKVERGMRMLADYERGMIIHVAGAHIALEKSLRRFPNKPLDLADAAYWSWHQLMGNDNWSMN